VAVKAARICMKHMPYIYIYIQISVSLASHCLSAPSPLSSTKHRIHTQKKRIDLSNTYDIQNAHSYVFVHDVTLMVGETAAVVSAYLG
jgi:hypothetical protein